MSIANLDCYFTIARQHLVCEDYALAGTEPIPHIIVCDGCSSSPNTDIGARIIATSAVKSLHEHFASPHETLPAYADFGYSVVNRAKHVIDVLGLHSSCLDATLLLAIPYHGQIYAYLYSDGYIAAINKSGGLEYRKLSYANNMPYYLTYWLDKTRRERYLLINPDGKGVLTCAEYRDGQEIIRQLDYDAPLIFTFPMAEYQLVALTSDGVSALVGVESDHKPTDREVLEQLLAYKTTKGDFVKRRAKRMLKQYEQQGIYPTDDFSVATLLIKTADDHR